MRTIFIGIALLLGSISVQAQTEKEELLEFPETMQSDMDSLYWDWQSKNYIYIDENCRMLPEGPSVSDSVYIDRLSRIPSIIELPFNEVVKKYIEAYTGRLRNKVSFMLAASNFYMPIFEEALDAYELPLELKYLPIIESALNPKAQSRVKASGLWQFMIRTGKAYGLESNSLVEERFDPVKSTWAAVRYLKELYGIYKDWTLVLAAYNSGPGNVNKAIRRAGGSTDYWDIYPFLPRETRGYVPGFIAVNYVMTYYCEHGICPMESELPAMTDTVHIHRDLHLQQVAQVCGIDIDQLRSMNPQYKKDLIPGNSRTYALRLPHNMTTTFIEKEDSIYTFDAKKYLNKRRTVAVNDGSKGKGNAKGASYYKIKKGDTLGGIAARHGVTVKQLQKLNNIKGTNIWPGKTIRIR